MKYTIDPSCTTRPMTTREENLIDHIASQTLFLEKELFFSINDLLSHTPLVLSGEKKVRHCVPDPDEIRKEIEQLDQMSESIKDNIETKRQEHDDEDPDHRDDRQGDYDIVVTLAGQKQALEDILKSAATPTCVPLLGTYRHDARGKNTVVLYVDNIDAAAAGDPVKAMSLMAYTLLHEYWHSFFHNAGIGMNPTFSCAEEPMAEFGSLVALDHALATCNPSSPIYADLDGTLKLAKDEVQAKQKRVGFVAAYGFGYYLYDTRLTDAEWLLAEFANVSSIIDPDALESRMYKYLVYPVYPAKEYEAYLHLIKLMAAAEMYGFTLAGPSATLRCTVKQSRMDAFVKALSAGLPRLTNTQIKNAATLYFAMRQHPEVRFSYTKDDGTLRHASGTLMSDLFDPPTAGAGAFKGSPDAIKSQSYFDTARNAWRSFRYDRLVSIGSRIRMRVV